MARVKNLNKVVTELESIDFVNYNKEEIEDAANRIAAVAAKAKNAVNQSEYLKELAELKKKYGVK